MRDSTIEELQAAHEQFSTLKGSGREQDAVEALLARYPLISQACVKSVEGMAGLGYDASTLARSAVYSVIGLLEAQHQDLSPDPSPEKRGGIPAGRMLRDLEKPDALIELHKRVSPQELPELMKPLADRFPNLLTMIAANAHVAGLPPWLRDWANGILLQAILLLEDQAAPAGLRLMDRPTIPPTPTQTVTIDLPILPPEEKPDES